AQLQRLAERQLQHLLGARGEGDVPARRLLPLTDDLGDLGADAVERDPERLQSLGRYALTLVDEAEQDVLRADVVVVQHPRLFLGEDDDPTGAIRKSLEDVLLPHARRTPAPAVPGLTATALCAPNAPMGRLMP